MALAQLPVETHFYPLLLEARPHEGADHPKGSAREGVGTAGLHHVLPGTTTRRGPYVEVPNLFWYTTTGLGLCEPPHQCAARTFPARVRGGQAAPGAAAVGAQLTHTTPGNYRTGGIGSV